LWGITILFLNNTISCLGAKIGGSLTIGGTCTLPSNSLAISTVNGLQTTLDTKQTKITNITSQSSFLYIFPPTDFVSWTPGGNSISTVTNNLSYPITNQYGVITNYASRITLSASVYNLYYSSIPITVGKIVIVRVWVKLGTATNCCLTFNNTVASNTIGGKAFSAVDGLNTSTNTQVEYSFVGPSSGFFHLSIGSHGETAVTQQTAGTVFVYGWQIFVADNNTNFNNPISCLGAN
jgi:hypothetical protein